MPHQIEFNRFQEHALMLLEKMLPFDSAWWGLMSGLNVHTEIKFRLPVTYCEDWERVKNEDPIATQAITHPFVTALFDDKKLSSYPSLQLMLKNYEIRQVLCTHAPEVSLGLSAFLSLYRSGEPFTEADRKLKEVVMPHMIYALRLSRRNYLETALLNEPSEEQLAANAICDRTGLIFSAEDLFARFKTIEWQRWRGPVLPGELLGRILNGYHFRGRKVRIVFREISGLFLVRVSERKLISELSPRELGVAERYSLGRTHKEIANEMGITPNTVRHYIRNVFGKTQVKNKAELSTMMAGLYRK
jgi:DNA-binding CsgD family transcriptional regulator